jgi:hypothetical protein
LTGVHEVARKDSNGFFARRNLLAQNAYAVHVPGHAVADSIGNDRHRLVELLEAAAHRCDFVRSHDFASLERRGKQRFPCTADNEQHRRQHEEAFAQTQSIDPMQ